MARFVVCASKLIGDIDGHDLTVGKVYEVIAEEKELLRIVDDSGEDYLYPQEAFGPAPLIANSAGSNSKGGEPCL